MKSQNGWSAAPDLKLRPLIVNGVSFLPGIRDDDDVETVLRYFWTEYDRHIEPLVNPGCWGFNFRENRNDPNSLSNHSSGTATDGNAPKHPNGVPTSRTFTTAQIAEVHRILGEVDWVLRWGGDYTGTPDAMHVEVNTDAATLRLVAERLRDDMYTDEDRKQAATTAADLAKLTKRFDRFADNSWRREAALAKALKDQGVDVDAILAKVSES